MISLINDDLKNSISRLKQELEKDIYFFGACGLVVGIMFIWQDRFNEFGIFKNSKWALGLFHDFIPWRAFLFILSCYMLLRMVSDRCNIEKLDAITLHISDRFYQFGSSIISFVLGLSLFSFGYFLVHIDLSAIRLSAITFIFSSFFAGIIVMMEVFAHTVREGKIYNSSFGLTVLFSLLNYIFIKLLAN
jgi:hypothetical protein